MNTKDQFKRRLKKPFGWFLTARNAISKSFRADAKDVSSVREIADSAVAIIPLAVTRICGSVRAPPIRQGIQRVNLG